MLVSRKIKISHKIGISQTQNQRGLCRRGRLQKILPLALTNAAKATLKPAHINEKKKCRRSYRPVEKKNETSSSNKQNFPTLAKIMSFRLATPTKDALYGSLQAPSSEQ